MSEKPRRKLRRKKFRRLINNLGTLNIVLACVFIYLIIINIQMLEVYRECGSAPESAWCALIAALVGECGICGWIKTTKDKQADRKWQEQQEKKTDTAMSGQKIDFSLMEDPGNNAQNPEPKEDIEEDEDE